MELEYQSDSNHLDNYVQIIRKFEKLRNDVSKA